MSNHALLGVRPGIPIANGESVRQAQPKGSQCMTCTGKSTDCSAPPFEAVKAIDKDAGGRRRNANDMTREMKVLQVLRRRPEGVRIPLQEIAHASGFDVRTTGRILSKLHNDRRASRVKDSGSGFNTFIYWLDSQQARDFDDDIGQSADSQAEASHGLRLSPVGINLLQRQQFLRHLKERTIFKDSPILDAIISDYRNLSRQLGGSLPAQRHQEGHQS